jgi:hypothetical protein
VDILALKASADITATDTTSLLRINSGGLIFNGATAPNISANLVFGTLGAAKEALVYVRDLQTGTATLSGSFTATNFTKSGPGTLFINGTGNVMAPLTTQLYTMQINEGVVRFGGQSSLPSNGNLILSPMDTGALDLAGVNLTIAGLGGNAAASAATGMCLTVEPQQRRSRWRRSRERQASLMGCSVETRL